MITVPVVDDAMAGHECAFAAAAIGLS